MPQKPEIKRAEVKRRGLLGSLLQRLMPYCNGGGGPVAPGASQVGQVPAGVLHHLDEMDPVHLYHQPVHFPHLVSGNKRNLQSAPLYRFS